MNDLNYGDDNFNFDPTQYQGASQTILPQPGTYRLKSTPTRKKDKNGQEVLVQGKFPVIRLNRVEIVEPEDDGGTFAVFQDVGSNFFPRPASGGRKLPASQVIDLIRAINVEKMSDIEGGDDRETVALSAVSVAEQELAAGETFTAKLGYKALDIEGAKAALRSVDPDDQKAKNEVWKAHTYRTKAFRNGNGYNTSVVTPDGKTLQAQLVIDTYVDSTDNQKLGPYFK
jgi:hypothetical protein